jgi:predicted RNase H-like nuclease (RuvC/YqgF family)
MGKKLDQALAEADEIEAAADAPNPSHINVSRPNRAPSKIVQVRLNPDEYAAIERIAEEHGLPVSTIARAQVLALLA